MSLPKCRLYTFLSCLLSLQFFASGMASVPSDVVERVRLDATAAQHTVAFSAVGGVGEQHTVVNAKKGESISVMFSAVIGYMPLIVAASAAEGDDVKEMKVPELSASEVRDALTKPPVLPEGIKAAVQPVPVPKVKQGGAASGMMVGAPVPYLTVLKVTAPGNYKIIFQVLRPWAPSTSDSSTFILQVHAAT